jgi:aromatic ring-opening dioxygenase catalytic subunit (LigB family)
MDDPMGAREEYARLSDWLEAFGKSYRGRVTGILVISAHWEEAQPTVHFGARPGMLYDYGGFPAHTYAITWPAPGNPALAARTEELLHAAGITSGREMERGYDHGTFVPFMVAFPEARLPVAQLSLVRGLDPVAHFAIGKALEPLRDEGILIVGSGMSYHNMRGFMSGDPSVAGTSQRFDDWLAGTVAIIDPEKRREALVNWTLAPGGLESHPRSEHLVPLFVVAGVAGVNPGRRSFHGTILGATVSGHVFGEDPVTKSEGS